MEAKTRSAASDPPMETVHSVSTTKTYRFGRFTRRIVLAIIDTMKPRWKDFDPQIDEEVCCRIERDFARFPLRAKMLILMMFHVVQWGGPLVWQFPVPFTWLSPAGRTDRLDRLRRSNRQVPHLIFKALKTMVLIVCYSCPSVERHLGLVRSDWQASRLRLREHLLAIDRRRGSLPPTPLPLGNDGAISADRLLHDQPVSDLSPGE